MIRRDDGAVVYPAPEFITRDEVHAVVEECVVAALAMFLDELKAVMRADRDRDAAIATADEVLG